MQAPSTIEDLNAEIARIRARAHKRRAAAWAMVPETVLGIELNPITPAIHSILVGTRNAYFTGEVPTEADLRNFVWFCSPQFNPDAPIRSLRWKWWQMLKLRLAIWRGATSKNWKEVVAGNFYRACVDVHEIVYTTFQDGIANVQSEEPREPIAASVEAQLVDMFAREYRQWPMPLPVRHTPIKQLNQLARCIDRRALGKEDKYHDSEEVECTHRFLKAVNQRN